MVGLQQNYMIYITPRSIQSKQNEPLVETARTFNNSWEIRDLILDALISIHKAGVQHGRIRKPHCSWHIVLSSDPDNPRPMIIDFKLASEHQCKLKFSKGKHQFRMYDWQPYDIRCAEFFPVVSMLNVWIPSMSL